jgi:hypothetical protein
VTDGGIALVEPWFAPGVLQPGRVSINTAESETVSVHELGLFTTEELLECFRQARLQATHDPKGPGGRGLFLAR